MELRQLEYFHMVSKEKNFTNAAKKLHVSQPSVTNSIHKLEEELGTQLFERNTKKVELTPEGQLFFIKVEKILENINDTVSDIRKFNLETIKLGLSPIIGAHIFPDIFLEFKKIKPNLELKVFEEGSLSIHEMLEKGDIDVGLVILPEKSKIIETLPLLKDEISVCIPAGHHLQDKKEISFNQLKKEKFILFKENYYHRKIISDKCKKHNFNPDIVISSSQIQTVKALVAKNIGISFLMNMAVDENENIIKVPLIEPLEINIGLAWKKNKKLSDASKEFINFLQNYF